MNASPSRRGRVRRFFGFFGEAVRDNEVNYTKEPVPRALGLLAIPMTARF